MPTRELTRPPRILPLYLRAAATLLPGASRLPGVPGSGRSIPALELTLSEVAMDPDRLAVYREVCGFGRSDVVPATYPHVLAFPLHMALMADPRFPFSPVGLVHVANEIQQSRPLRPHEALSFAVSATPPQAHPRGQVFTIVTTGRVGEEPLWSERSTMLRRGGGGRPAADSGRDGGTDEAASAAAGPAEVLARSRWSVPGDIGRRYGSVSGDRNPIHMHSLGGRAFGFRGAIAHGMWTKARCLAAIEGDLPDAFAVAVRFRRPIVIPASVSFEAERRGADIDFAVRSAMRDDVHLEATLAAGAVAETANREAAR